MHVHLVLTSYMAGAVLYDKITTVSMMIQSLPELVNHYTNTPVPEGVSVNMRGPEKFVP